MLTKLLRSLTVAIVLILTAGSLYVEAQQLPSNILFEKIRDALASGVDKSTSNTQSQSYQTNVSFNKDLNTLKMGDEVTMSITIQNLSAEPITNFAALLNFPSQFFMGTPGKTSPDGTNIYYFNSSIGDYFGIKEVTFSHGQFYNTPFNLAKQAENEANINSIHDQDQDYGVYPINGISPLFVWLMNPTTKNGSIQPNESAVLQITLIAEMPTILPDKKTSDHTTDNILIDYQYTLNTIVIKIDEEFLSIDESEFNIEFPDSEPEPVSFYMTSFGLESSDVGNTAGYYLTIVNRAFSSTLLLDLKATMPQDLFVEFFKYLGDQAPPALGFSTYHSIYSMFYNYGTTKMSEGTVSADKQENGYYSNPAFNYNLVQPTGQSYLQLQMQEYENCNTTKTTSVNGVGCDGIIMPPGIMTIFIQGTPMPNGNGTTMTMDAELIYVDSYSYDPYYYPPKSVSGDNVDEHFESALSKSDSASFNVSPVVVTYEAMNDSCPVNGDEIGYVMTVQGIDYPRLPGQFSIFQRVDDKQDVTMIDFQRPISNDPYYPFTSVLVSRDGNNGGLLYTYGQFESGYNKAAKESTQDDEYPSLEELVINYVNTFKVVVNADVATTESLMAGSVARLSHYLDLTQNYSGPPIKSVGVQSSEFGDIEIPSDIPEGFIYDLMFNTQVEVNCFSNIAGVKYLDANGNGTRDNGEPGIAGVEIQLVNLSNVVVASTITVQDGSYLFEEVPPAYYALREVVPAGYAQSEPNPVNSSHYSIKAVPGVDLEGLNFGNYAISTLQVFVFHDYNRNGIKDAGEPMLPNWDVRLVQESYQYDRTSTTEELGTVVFSNLRPGAYSLAGALPEYWVVTTTDEPLLVDIQNGTSNELVIGRDFDEVGSPDVATAIIRGTVFNDTNANAMWSFPGESGLKGRVVQLIGVSDKGVEVNRTVTTDELGRYEFTQLPPGMYEVRHAASDGISSTWPTSGLHILKLDEGEVLGSWASGGPGGAGWLQAVDAGDDSTPAVMQLVLDMDGDGAGDSYVSATGRAKLSLAGTTGMEQRPFVVQNVTMYGRDSQGSSILLATPGVSQEGGLLAGSSTVVGQELTFGLVIEIDGQYAYSTGSMSYGGQTDRWPIRNASAQFNTMQGATPADLRNPFGQLVGRILFAEITPLYGIDFGAEHADFGDADLQSGTLRVGFDVVPQLTSSGLAYPFDGARHTLPLVGASLPVLGAGVTADSDGKPTESADSDVDDGVVLPQAVAPGASFTAEISVTGSGKLSAWIDWNNNKLFDAGEKVLNDTDVTGDESPFELSIAVPAGVADGALFVRFRLSTQAGLGAYGAAADGEVEDYVVTVDGSLADGGGGLPTNDPDANSGIPTDFRLIGAWPNPFNPTTNISFDLPEAASVRVDVVDMLGRQVMSMAPRTMGSGANLTITLDASKLSSGVYMYRVIAEGATETFVQGSKFTLVK